MIIVESRQGQTVDLICQAHYGYTSGAVERVLDVNLGLAALGPVLPIGTGVRLPDIHRPPRTAPLVTLWD